MFPVKKFPKFKMFQIFLQFHRFVALEFKVLKIIFGVIVLIRKGNL